MARGQSTCPFLFSLETWTAVAAMWADVSPCHRILSWGGESVVMDALVYYDCRFLAAVSHHSDREIELQKTRCITDKRITGNPPACSSFEISKPVRFSRSSSWMLNANLGPPKSKRWLSKLC